MEQGGKGASWAPATPLPRAYRRRGAGEVLNESPREPRHTPRWSRGPTPALGLGHGATAGAAGQLQGQQTSDCELPLSQAEVTEALAEAAVTRSGAHWPRRDGVFLCAALAHPCPAPRLIVCKRPVQKEEGQSRGSLVTDTSRKSLASRKSAQGGRGDGDPRLGQRRRRPAGELLGQNVPKWLSKRKN